jgi:hypothetical protein
VHAVISKKQRSLTPDYYKYAFSNSNELGFHLHLHTLSGACIVHMELREILKWLVHPVSDAWQMKEKGERHFDSCVDKRSLMGPKGAIARLHAFLPLDNL